MALVRQGSLGAGQSIITSVDGGRDESGVDYVVETRRCNRDEVFSFIPARNAPWSGNSNLLCKNVRWQGIRLNLAEIVSTYAGLAAGTVSIGSVPPVYSLGYIQRTEPLNAHPEWSAIATAIGTQAVNDSFRDGVFIAIAQTSNVAELRGASEYFDMGLAWRQVKLETGMPSLADINKVFTTAQLPGSPPSGVPSGRNWLLSQIEGQEEGNVVRVTRTWILSGRNGWTTTPAVYVAK